MVYRYRPAERFLNATSLAIAVTYDDRLVAEIVSLLTIGTF